MYDIIGDIHGYANHLEKLLQKLGYTKRLGVYHHPVRKVIFMGDFVDRGPDVKGVLQIVKPMVEEGSARSILGNHEYNLIAFFSRRPNGRFLRYHTVKNIRQVKSTLKAFDNSQKKLNKYLEWFKTLPLFIEEPGLRVVHATWFDPYIKYLKKNYPKNVLSDKLLYKSYEKQTKEFEVIEALLKGIEIKLPKGVTFLDVDGNLRKDVRIKWWETTQGKTYRDLATREVDKVPDFQIPPEVLKKNFAYNLQEPPLFLGHYCLRETKPFLFTKNVACLDFCVVKNQTLTAYRWDGEQELLAEKFVQVN